MEDLGFLGASFLAFLDPALKILGLFKPLLIVWWEIGLLSLFSVLNLKLETCA